MAAAQRATAGASLLAVMVALAPMRVDAAPAAVASPSPTSSIDTRVIPTNSTAAAPTATAATTAATSPTTAATSPTTTAQTSPTTTAAPTSPTTAAPTSSTTTAATSPTTAAPTSQTTAAPTSPAASMQPAPSGGAQTGNSQEPARRWQIRQAPLAGAESSWGPPGGQMPEYVEFTEPQATQGPPPRGTPRIVSGAILGPLGLALAIAGIVGATTDVLGEQKRLSVPMVGFGLVTTAIGWGLFADGILRRKKFNRWQAKGGQVALAPMLVPGRLTGVSLGLRF